MNDESLYALNGWYVALAVVVRERSATATDVMRAGLALTHTANGEFCSTVHVNHMTRTLEKLEGAGLVSKHGSMWRVTAAGVDAFLRQRDSLARIAAIDPPKGPPA